MAVNARTEEFQHIEVFDKPALFTNGRIARDTVPKGWYCYDIRGSDDDPGELCYMEENVVVNHAGSVLMPEKLAIPKSGRLDVRDELGFLDEGDMTLREFCEAHQLPYPAENMKFHIRPARPEEAGLFYTPHPEEDKRRGTIGHIRMDFGRSGNEFWHTWWPRGPEELNSPAFKAELQQVVDMMREDILKSRFSMERFCYEHGGKITGGYVQNYEDAEYHNAVFVGTDASGIPRHAHKRSANSYGKAFRLNVEGSDPRYSFHHVGTDRSLYVFEAPIDMLSYITLYPEDWQRHGYVACCGTSIQPVLQMLEQRPQLDTVLLCLDNDEAGHQASRRMREQLEVRYSVERLIPANKDWNDDLTLSAENAQGFSMNEMR